MSEQHLKSALRLSLAFAATAMVLTAPAGAQQAPGTAPQVEVQQATGPTEEVIVTGQRTLRSLINEGQRETEDFYARLNEVIDNPDFRIRCVNEYPPGSNILTRVCRMRYQEELLERMAQSALRGLGTTDQGELVFGGQSYDSLPEAMQMQQRFFDEMLQAVNADAELNASALKLMQLKAAVESYQSPRRVLRGEQRTPE